MARMKKKEKMSLVMTSHVETDMHCDMGEMDDECQQRAWMNEDEEDETHTSAVID